MRNLAVLGVFTLVVAACGGGTTAPPPTATVDQSSVVATEVAHAVQATADVQSAINAAVEATRTAEALAQPPTPTPAPLTPTSTPVPPTVEPTHTPVPPPPPAPEMAPVDELAAQGYYPFERDEISLMIHPRLDFDDIDQLLDDDEAEYVFTDFEAPYLHFEVAIDKSAIPKRSISDAEARSFVEGTMRNSEHISTYEIVASDETSIEGHPGRVVRTTFVTNGSPAYGVLMLISDGPWLYRFDIYGDEYEYNVIEEILKSIFDSAHLSRLEATL